MKKFLLLTGMILAMGAFQSLKAQTFSRVVTFGIDTVTNSSGLYGVVYKVPPNKVFKISYIDKDISYDFNNIVGNNSYYGRAGITNPISINSYPLRDGALFSSTKEQEGIWLKSGDEIRFNATGGSYSVISYSIKIFLSGIEYDVP